MTITFRIKTDNEAFTPDAEAEVERIIKSWADTCMRFRTLYDINGHKVGIVTVTGR